MNILEESHMVSLTLIQLRPQKEPTFDLKEEINKNK